MRLKYIILSFFLLAVTGATARPHVAVNIIVSGMGASDMDRYSANFCTGGFRRLTDNGAVLTECYMEFAPTTSATGAATLASGAMPSMHGIVSNFWYDRTTNRRVDLCCQTKRQETRPYSAIDDRYSAECVVAQTLSETILADSPSARAVTIAHTPVSAILTAGRRGECYWLDERGSWGSAECYMSELPEWVRLYNEEGSNRQFAASRWYGKYTHDRYVNSRSSAITTYKSNSKVRIMSLDTKREWIRAMYETPSGLVAIFEFAKRAVGTMFPLRVDEGCNVLNVYLDAPRIVAERYGSDSLEYEDMLYCLDVTLADFLMFLYAQTDNADDILVTLCSDHGMSPVCDNETNLFNAQQFEVIVNAFLSARYGQAEWVLGYCDNSLYLNHDVIYKRGKSLDAVQREVAAFALQFRGVAYAVAASAFQNGYFGSGVMHFMQNGFYPRRSGDVVIALMPERIEAREPQCLSLSGSPYNYDRHIPLVICGGGVPAQHIDRRSDACSLAPTIARLMGVRRPSASIAEIIDLNKDK